MADLFLNFKDFHHEHTDDKSTTLKHKKLGHKITLAHNVLSPKNKQALMDMAKSAKKMQTSDQVNEAESQDSGYGKVIRMAEGGDTKQDYVPPAEHRDPRAVPPPRQKTQNERLHDVGHGASGGTNKPTLDPRSWWAEGGEIEQAPNGDVPQPYAEGTPDQPVQQAPADSGSAADFQHQVGEAIGKYGIKPVIDFVKGAYNEGARAITGAKEGIEAVASGAMNVGEGALKGADIQVPQAPPEPPPLDPASIKQPPPPPAPMPEVPDQGLAAPQQPQKADPMDKSMQSTESGMNKGYAAQMQGIKGEAEAKGAMGAEQALAHQANIKAETEAKDHFQQNYNELEKERQSHMADIKNGYIDPNQYWTGDKNGNGGHSKIAAGIGMILAGFNPTNSPNAAINFLKYQMDQNLEAQKQNLGAKGNLLSANLRQFGNLSDATKMTQLMQNDIMINELNTAAAKAQNPLAKNAALQAVGQLQREQAVNSQKFAMQRAMINMANNNASPNATEKMLGYMRLYAPEQAKEMEQRYVPGVGMGAVAIPQDVRGQIIASKNTNDLFNSALHMANQPIPNPATHPMEYRKFVATADTLRNQMIGTIKQQQHDGVYKPSEAEFLINQIGNSPASVFRALSSVPKLQEMQRIKQGEYTNLLSTYGIHNAQPLPTNVHAGPTPNAAHPLEGKTIENAQGQRAVMKNGKWVPVGR